MYSLSNSIKSLMFIEQLSDVVKYIKNVDVKKYDDVIPSKFEAI